MGFIHGSGHIPRHIVYVYIRRGSGSAGVFPLGFGG
jgi:hypothetical protein